MQHEVVNRAWWYWPRRLFTGIVLLAVGLFLLVEGGGFVAGLLWGWEGFTPPLWVTYHTRPHSISTVYAQAAGTTGLQAYFGLQDTNGVTTTGAGTARVTLYQQLPEKADALLYVQEYPVSADCFRAVTIGTGAAQHDGVVCLLPPVPYSEMYADVRATLGRVAIQFTPAGGGPVMDQSTPFVFPSR